MPISPTSSPATATHAQTGIVSRAGPVPTASGVLLTGVNGEFVLVDPATGARRWSVRLQVPVVQPALLDGHFMITASVRGEVVAFR